MTFWLCVCICCGDRVVLIRKEIFFLDVLCVLRFNATRIFTILWANDCIVQNIQHTAAVGHSSNNGGGGHTPKIFIIFLNIIFYYLIIWAGVMNVFLCDYATSDYMWVCMWVGVEFFFLLYSVLSFDYIKRKSLELCVQGSRGANDKKIEREKNASGLLFKYSFLNVFLIFWVAQKLSAQEEQRRRRKHTRKILKKKENTQPTKRMKKKWNQQQ